MFAFGMLVKAERASLRSCSGFIRQSLEGCGLTVQYLTCTGMISQNNTPSALIPLLRRFDGEFGLGEYVLAIATKS